MIRARLPDDEVVVEDLKRGALVQRPQAEHGDVVVRDAQGNWTYQFAVVVDDMRHGVNLIVRGEDLVPSTGRQMLLARLLGRATPVVTVHHRLVLAEDGKKLSKRERSETVKAMRGRGMGSNEIASRVWDISGIG